MLEEPFGASAKPPRATRADALASREAILAVAAGALSGDRRLTMIDPAAAAGVGRPTLYRHFPSRAALNETLEQRRPTPSLQLRAPSGQLATLPYLPPGRLGRERLPLEVT